MLLRSILYILFDQTTLPELLLVMLRSRLYFNPSVLNTFLYSLVMCKTESKMPEQTGKTSFFPQQPHYQRKPQPRLNIGTPHFGRSTFRHNQQQFVSLPHTSSSSRSFDDLNCFVAEGQDGRVNSMPAWTELNYHTVPAANPYQSLSTDSRSSSSQSLLPVQQLFHQQTLTPVSTSPQPQQLQQRGRFSIQPAELQPTISETQSLPLSFEVYHHSMIL